MIPALSSPPTRTKAGRTGVLLLMAGFAFLCYLKTLPPLNPLAPRAVVSPPLLTFTAARWRSGCEATPTFDEIGLYTTTDRPCRPSRYVSLGWLQNQLQTAHALTAAEYLTPEPEALAANCLARIWANAETTPRGWLCIDGEGLYRTDNAGHGHEGHWVAWGQ